MDGLKQRIIGALVLVSLAVIFVPMLFDEPHSERSSTTIQIPEEPPFPEVEAPETEVAPAPSYDLRESAPEVPEPGAGESEDAPAYRILEEGSGAAPFSEVRGPADPGQATADNSKQSVETTADASAPAAEPEAVEYQRSLEGAWVVQLGSFGNEDNARRLRDKVREKGYGSHLQAVVRGDTKLTRVFSGPFVTKSEAEAAKRALDDAFGVNSLVTSGEE